MKFSIVNIDKNKEVHLSVKTPDWFFDRIKTDTKSETVGNFRREVASSGNYIGEKALALVYPAVELTKSANRRLTIAAFNSVVPLYVPNLMSAEDRERVKASARMLPMTLAAFDAADGRSALILVAVAAKACVLTTEAEMDVFCERAYETAYSLYNSILPKEIERRRPSARTAFRMTLDAAPYYNTAPVPIDVMQYDTAAPQQHQTADIDTTGQRQIDMDLYTDYERIYEQAAEEAYDSTEGVVESQWYEAYLTELASGLCEKGVPQEEAFVHVRNHHVNRQMFDEAELRAIVDAVYSEQHHQQSAEGAAVSRETRRLIRFLNTRYVFRKNAVMGYTEYRPNTTWLRDWAPCDENAIYGIAIEARLADLDVREKDVRRYVYSSHIPTCDPIDNYLVSVANKWDGKTDHIAMLARCVPCDIPQWETWFKKWFVAMVAQWLLPAQEYGNSIVPLLISPQGDGKTTFCRMILPRELRWGFLENLDVSEKRQTLQAMHNFLLVNLDEFNQISPKLQAGFLKNVIQLPSVKIKRPYGKHVEEFKRYASFIATTNETNVLTDPTGSRRFICVQLKGPIRTDYVPNYEALYAQACHIVWNRTMNWWFDADEVRQIMAHNDNYQVLPPSLQYFLEYYEPAESTADGGQWLSPTAIYDSLRRLAGSGLKTGSVASFGRHLASLPELQQRRMGRSRQYLVKKK